MKETRSTCPYCGVGCGVIIQSQGEQITGVRGDPDHPANFGRLCSKGSSLHLTASQPVTSTAIRSGFRHRPASLSNCSRRGRPRGGKRSAWSRSSAAAIGSARLVKRAPSPGKRATGALSSSTRLIKGAPVAAATPEALLLVA